MLGQLAAHLGDEVFFGGLRYHFDDHAYGNATFADLIGAWTRAGARDLPAWADAWLRTSGLDTLSADGERLHRSTLVADPDPVDPPPTPRPHTVQVAGFDLDGRELARSRVTLTDQSEVPAAAAGPPWWSPTPRTRPGRRSGSAPPPGGSCSGSRR